MFDFTSYKDLVFDESNIDNDINEQRKHLANFLSWLKQAEGDDYQDYQNAFAELRQLKVETLEKFGGIFYPDDLEVPVIYNDRNLRMFQGRYIYPIKSTKGEIYGFTGYDADQPDNKYIDLKCKGFDTPMFIGLQNMPEYYKNNKTIFIVEGVVCQLFMLENGFQVLSSMGSHLSQYQLQFVKRLERRIIVIADNDTAGDNYVAQVKRYTKARTFQFDYAKDIDDSRKVNLEKTLKILNQF